MTTSNTAPHDIARVGSCGYSARLGAMVVGGYDTGAALRERYL